jgi:hypothetical protein
MDFWQTMLVLARRWYVTVPATLASLGLCAMAYLTVPVQYESMSILVLTTPLTGGTTSSDPDAEKMITNPMLSFDRSLALSASLVIQEMSSPETVSSLGVQPGGTTGYIVTNGSTNPELMVSGPFLFVTGRGPSAPIAEDITRRAAAKATEVLAERQKQLRAPDSTHIGVQEVTAPTRGRPEKGSNMRAAAAMGALCAIGTLTAVFGFESIMTNRRRRPAETRAASAGARVDPQPRAPVVATTRTTGTETDGAGVLTANGRAR